LKNIINSKLLFWVKKNTTCVSNSTCFA